MMVPFKYKSVVIESMAVNLPQTLITSSEIEDRISPLYERLGVPFGTLERLSGISTRGVWDEDVMPSQISTEAAKRALDQSSVPRDEIKTLFNCSVTRDYFEPATACLVHKNLGFSHGCMVMDISNACIGFSNGMLMTASLIESGTIKAGLVVSGETVGRIINSSIQHLLHDETITREQLLKILPTFTIGSGAVAFVLCHESLAKNGHRLIGSVSRSATEYSELCSGNGDYQLRNNGAAMPMMYTESSKIISSAAKLGSSLFADFTEVIGWTSDDIDHIFCHQVGRQVGEAFYKQLGLNVEKEFIIYKEYGNLVSAAMPSALTVGAEKKGMKHGDKVILTAFGSGLNAIFTGLVW